MSQAGEGPGGADDAQRADSDSGVEIVAQAGYRPELRRSLRSFSIFAIAFSVISITTGIFLNYGFGLSWFGPAAIWTWPIVAVGNMLIALIVAELGTRIPLAGYAYQWSSRLVNSSYGWFVGFAGLLYMAVGGGAVMLVAAGPLLLSEFGVDSATHPHLNLAVSIVLMLIATVVNIVSVQFSARVNNIAVFTEILGTVLFSVLLIVLWGLQTKHTPYGFSILTTTTRLSHSPGLYSFGLAGMLGIFTLIGFELAADMSEDAVNPRHSVPRGMIYGLAISAVLGFVALLGFTLAIPNLKLVEHSSLPLLTIAKFWLAPWLVKAFVAFVVFSMFAIAVVGAGAQSRLAFSMARDNMLPGSRFLRKVDPHTQTPIVALLVLAVIDIAILVYGYTQPNSFGTLVGATAIIPYLIYFAITVAYAVRRNQIDSFPGAFSLGRWATPVIAVVLVWTMLIIGVLTLSSAFNGADQFLALAAILALLWYGTVLFRRLQRGEAGVETIEELSEHPR
jgi:amino acid transporter